MGQVAKRTDVQKVKKSKCFLLQERELFFVKNGRIPLMEGSSSFYIKLKRVIIIKSMGWCDCQDVIRLYVPFPFFQADFARLAAEEWTRVSSISFGRPDVCVLL